MVRTGRRPGKPDTRAAIVAAARREFAASGYAGATIRTIAAGAHVDPALVYHYFGGKRELFVAAMDLPFDPGDLLAAGLDAAPERAGESIVRAFLSIWGSEAGGAAAQSLLRSAMTDDEVLGLLRGFMTETVLIPITSALAPDHPELRAGLVASQIVGLAMVRYVMEIEPLASADVEAVVAMVGPGVQRYLTGSLGG